MLFAARVALDTKSPTAHVDQKRTYAAFGDHPRDPKSRCSGFQELGFLLQDSRLKREVGAVTNWCESMLRDDFTSYSISSPSSFTSFESSSSILAAHQLLVSCRPPSDVNAFFSSTKNGLLPGQIDTVSPYTPLQDRMERIQHIHPTLVLLLTREDEIE